MNKSDLKLDWCSYQAAKYAVEKWHYSKTLPANRSNYIGVWENGSFRGVVIFGMGASPSLGKPYGLKNGEFAELTRVAIRKHESSISRIVAIAIRMLRKKTPGLKILISFADPFHGHNGAIYQAGNWIYAGKSAASGIYKMPNGDLIDPRRFNGHGHNSPKEIPREAVKIRTPGKHRYLYPLDDEMRKQIEPLRKPYPKRISGGSNLSDAPGDHPGEGGSIPTPPLHSEVRATAQ